jgi:hypothetical protein
MSKTGWAIISAMLLVLAGLLYHYKLQSAIPAEDASQMSSPIAEASYSCDQGHTIRAAYFDGPPAAAPAEGQPPKPTGSVEISFLRTAAATATAIRRFNPGNRAQRLWSFGIKAIPHSSCATTKLTKHLPTARLRNNSSQKELTIRCKKSTASGWTV